MVQIQDKLKNSLTHRHCCVRQGTFLLQPRSPNQIESDEPTGRIAQCLDWAFTAVPTQQRLGVWQPKGVNPARKDDTGSRRMGQRPPYGQPHIQQGNRVLAQVAFCAI